jgi:predicted NAD-dependent protein-ADP-ribosyltransferase YbiA (DUF1768 family)
MTLEEINKQINKTIYFWNTISKYGYMSNFYPCEFVDENNTKYNCSEQKFMKMKQEKFDPNKKNLIQII